MENDCHMILEQFPNYKTGMDLAVYCFYIHRKKKCNAGFISSNDMCSQVCASTFLSLENTARALIHLFRSRFILKVHSIPVTHQMHCLLSFCQSFERLSWNIHVLLDLSFLPNYPSITLWSSVQKFLRISVFSSALREKVFHWHGTGKTNEHLFCVEGWIPSLHSPECTRRSNQDSG